MKGFENLETPIGQIKTKSNDDVKDKTADINLAEKQTGGKRKENECEQLNRNYFKDKLKDYQSDELDNIFENNERFMNPFSNRDDEIE